MNVNLTQLFIEKLLFESSNKVNIFFLKKNKPHVVMICILSQKKKSRSSLTFFDGLSSFFYFYKPEEVNVY